MKEVVDFEQRRVEGKKLYSRDRSRGYGKKKEAQPASYLDKKHKDLLQANLAA